MAIVKPFQCGALDRHKSFTSVISIELNTFQAACNLFASINAPNAVQTQTFDTACATFTTAATSLTLFTSDKYAALDVTSICALLGSRKTFVVPTLSLCTTDEVFANPTAVFIPGTTSVALTANSDYVASTFDSAEKACITQVLGLPASTHVHLVTGDDCASGATPENLIESISNTLSLCGAVMATSIGP